MLKFFAEKNVSSFCSAKATHIFSAKNIRILCIESAKTVNEMTLNELVKLTTLWTTGPWFYGGWPRVVRRMHSWNMPGFTLMDAKICEDLSTKVKIWHWPQNTNQLKTSQKPSFGIWGSACTDEVKGTHIYGSPNTTLKTCAGADFCKI